MAETRSGGGRDQLEGPAAGGHAPPPHVVAEGGEGQRLGDLRLGDVRAAAVAAVEVAVADELIEGRPDSQPGHAQVDRELALGRDRAANLEAFDQVEDAVASLL